jgi:bifunctional DNA-binding transcriptional regulator/antitoxin component of YhaV-PrlF toxin-antitoxin module
VNVPKEKIIQVTQVTSRHQTTIPVEILKFLGINPEGAVVWILKNGEVIVRRQ